MTDKQWDLLVINLNASDTIKRLKWMEKQSPLIQALHTNDAEDDTNHLQTIKTTHNAR